MSPLPTAHDVGSALIAECERRLFTESLPRLLSCLAAMTPDDVWHRPNAHANSAGNLVLHLCGNVGQWIGSALGGAPDRRARSKEFTEAGPMPAAELRRRLEETMAEARAAIAQLDPAKLLETRRVQGFEESVLSILVHVVEHFSYHTGQVAWIAKARRDVDLRFYSGVDLERKA